MTHKYGLSRNDAHRIDCNCIGCLMAADAARRITRPRAAEQQWRAQPRVTHDTGRHGDRPRDDLGLMRLIVWCVIVLALLGIASLVLLAPTARAAEVEVVLHGLSLHGSDTRPDGADYNERNPGAGLRLQTTTHTAVQAGRYRNSWSGPDRTRHSTYAVVDALPYNALGARVGGFVGAANGYPWQGDGTEHRWQFVAGAVARWQAGRLSLAVRATPSKHSRGVAAIELGVRL